MGRVLGLKPVRKGDIGIFQLRGIYIAEILKR